MSRVRKPTASAPDPYEGWTLAQLTAELASMGYHWAAPPEPMTIAGRPVCKILDADSFRAYLYLGPMLYWHFRIERDGGIVRSSQLVRGSGPAVVRAASHAALLEIDRVAAGVVAALRA